jgi:hypothetical protein
METHVELRDLFIDISRIGHSSCGKGPSTEHLTAMRRANNPYPDVDGLLCH